MAAWPPDSPLAGLTHGMPVLSEGRAAVIEPGLAPGEYALVTWTIDLDSGTMRAASGMHQLVTVV